MRNIPTVKIAVEVGAMREDESNHRIGSPAYKYHQHTRSKHAYVMSRDNSLPDWKRNYLDLDGFFLQTALSHCLQKFRAFTLVYLSLSSRKPIIPDNMGSIKP